MRSKSSSNPSRGTTFVSMPRAVPANVIVEPGRRAASSRAIAMPGYRWPPVPPPAITARSGPAPGAVELPRASGSASAVISVVITCVDEACCETFSRIPMPIMLISSDEPPKLTNGSGMPLVGSSPSTTLMLKNACTTTIAVSPSARNAPKRSGARIAVRRPRQAMTQKQASTSVVPSSPSSSPMTA